MYLNNLDVVTPRQGKYIIHLQSFANTTTRKANIFAAICQNIGNMFSPNRSEETVHERFAVFRGRVI